MAYGHRQPEKTSHHAARHDRQMAAIDRHHAARNREGGHHVHDGARGGALAANVGGSSQRVRDEGNKGGRAAGAGNSGMPAFKRAMSGNPDSD